jgi:DNA-directed RNA polymerase specialized sigma24 family protein
MTFHKARNATKFHQRERRDVRRDQFVAGGEESSDILGQLVEIAPQEEDVAVLFDCLERLLARLPDNYREIVVRRLEGSSIEEIALAVQRSRRTVLRVLAHVQELAVRELESP